MKEKTLFATMVGLAAAALLGGVLMASSASAHHTGNERRTVPACQTLRPALRGPCRACVTRPRPHHFHPRRPPGDRCQPNNGRRT